MGLFQKKHIHVGKAIGSRKHEWSWGSSRLPHRWTTEVRAICEKCGSPFSVEYDGVFEEEDFKDATIRSK